MSWRWLLWSSVIGLIALVLLMPLRVALPASDLQQMGLSARQVAGTIWYGRIAELMLGRQLLGTFDVRLDPAALLLGRIAMPFERLDAAQGPLTGVLRARVLVRSATPPPSALLPEYVSCRVSSSRTLAPTFDTTRCAHVGR